MNKRGQFYLITVVILSLAILAILVRVNTIKEPILFEDFSQLSKNYITESRYTINYAIYNDQQDIQQIVDRYTQDFLTEAQKRNPKMGLVYVYSEGDTVTVTNYLDESIQTFQGTQQLGAGEDLIQAIEVEIGGTKFIHQVPVSVEDFGAGWYTLRGDPDIIDLNIGGIAHTFDVLGEVPEFKIIVRTSENQYDFFVAEGTQGGGIVFSPHPEENLYKSIQQKVSK